MFTVIGLVVTIIVIGVLLWIANTYLAPYMDPKVVKILNAVVIVCLILWLLHVFGLLPLGETLPVPRIR